ncbi:MAG: PspC domain-containing protein [Clostridiales Family XIII bacterium]|jgi:phage shock protein PspC (stress-responsive transcriptional regulator)|nr:PspC domain-containing protein [Clostridiales Family XIII bacterium]
MNKRLYRSSTDRAICGVCGGIAEYFDIDSVIVRLLMVVFALMGAGVVFYIFAAIIMREESPRLRRSAYDRQTPPPASGDAAESYSDEFAGTGPAGAESAEAYAADAKRARASGGRSSGAMIVGLVLILIGMFYLINRYVPIFYWLDFRVIFAVVLVLVGIFFVAKR